jgi:hypothetical protein
MEWVAPLVSNANTPNTDFTRAIIWSLGRRPEGTYDGAVG